MEPKDYAHFVFHFKQLTGIDLSLYKEEQMKRRLNNLLMKKGCSNFSSYAQKLKTDEGLLKETLDHITINVTEFFRNDKHWDVFYQKVVPLFKEKRKIRIWSAACSTGEEPYTISMIMMKHFPHKQFEVIATDLDQTVLSKAKEGVYLFNSTTKIESGFVQSYFEKLDANLYRIQDKVKKQVTFKQHNLLKDMYMNDVDIIVCRNVMIYFTEEAKDEIYRKFSRTLNENGVLFVGATEQILKPQQYQFETLETFFYQKKKK